MKKTFFAFTAALGMMAALQAADDDFAFVYRGRITAQTTMPTELEVTYSLYKGENDSTAVWSITKTETPSSDGSFQSVLSGSGLREAFADTKARYLGIKLGSGDEQHPRQQILAAPLTDFADAVLDVPSDPVFINAAVKQVNAGTATFASLAVTNSLNMAGGNDDAFTIDKVTVASGATLTLPKPEGGTVSLFDAAPWKNEITTEGTLGQGTKLFSSSTSKGGLVVATTSNPSRWNSEYAAPCITWFTGPGEILAPVKLAMPLNIYFYEFGN